MAPTLNDLFDIAGLNLPSYLKGAESNQDFKPKSDKPANEEQGKD